MLPSQNLLGGNHQSGFKYRNFRRRFKDTLEEQLNAVPRANQFRAGIITRQYGKGRRLYDVENFIGGCKPLVDVLKAYAVILNDSPSCWRGYYLQERSADGLDRFTIELIEYA